MICKFKRKGSHLNLHPLEVLRLRPLRLLWLLWLVWQWLRQERRGYLSWLRCQSLAGTGDTWNKVNIGAPFQKKKKRKPTLKRRNIFLRWLMNLSDFPDLDFPELSSRRPTYCLYNNTSHVIREWLGASPTVCFWLLPLDVHVITQVTIIIITSSLLYHVKPGRVLYIHTKKSLTAFNVLHVYRITRGAHKHLYTMLG